MEFISSEEIKLPPTKQTFASRVMSYMFHSVTLRSLTRRNRIDNQTTGTSKAIHPKT